MYCCLFPSAPYGLPKIMVKRSEIAVRWNALILLLGVLPVTVLSLLPQALWAGEEDPATLTFDRVFKSGEFSAQSYGGTRWREETGDYIMLKGSEETRGGQDIVVFNPETGQKAILIPAAYFIPPNENSPLSISSYQFSDDRSLLLIFTNTKRVWRQNTRGDYWVLDVSSRELRQLGGDAEPSTLMFAEFSPDGTHVCYVRENDLYVENLKTQRIRRLTNTGGERLINGTFDWVYEEELSLRKGFRWSPDSQSIAYWQLDTEGVRKVHLINNTDSLYPKLIPIKYPKVGEQNASCRVGVIQVDGGRTRWMEVPGDPRNHYIARMDWAGNSEELLLQQLNRLQNTNRVMMANAQSGEVRTILVEHDDAWVDIEDELHWIEEGERFTWVSERDGWRHVYLVSRSGDKTTLITRGDHDVWGIDSIDEENSWLYYTASPDNATQRYLYKVSLKGGKGERVTPADQSGTHRYRVSHDSQWAIHSWSSFGTPSTTDLIRLPSHERVRMLVENTNVVEKLQKLNQGGHEFFSVDIGEAVLDGWCIKPPDLDQSKQYPLLFYVYGEPAGSTVGDLWGGQNYLWYLYLAQQGYVVMSVDNRGTRVPKGRAWRKCIYRQVGILAPAEQAAATREIIDSRPYIDPRRVAIWGWSGGGSMTLNAIFRYPEIYHTGMAVAPVPNQRYYDTIYQERYMGLPSENVDGFKDGSPINFAHQLKGNLLVVHGTGDDNCHYQGTEALINELIRHDKEFTMMAYPNRTHSISEGKNTRRHLYRLLTNYLMDKMPPGPVEPLPSSPSEE